MPLQSSLVHLGLGKEVIQGTAVAPTIWLPVSNNIKDEDVVHWIEDKSLVGAPVDPYAVYAGPKSSDIQYDANFRPDIAPHQLVALMGSDTVTGAAAPYTHTIGLTAAQPPSYTLSVYNGYNERQYPGCMEDQLDLKWAMDGPLVGTAKWAGWPSAVGDTTVPSFGTADPLLAWQTTCKIAGAANPRLIGFDWTGKRGAVVQNTASGSQTPTFTYVGPFAVTGKLSFAVNDDTELDYLLNNTQPAVQILLTAPNNGPTLKIQMSKCSFQKKSPSYSKEFVVVDYDIAAYPNPTDAIAGGPISPVQFVVTNTQQTAY